MVIKMFFLVMLFLLSGGSAEVVTDFQKACGGFFKNGISPTVLPGTQYKQICQTLDNQAYYATLYDTENKIPVYSAYVFEGKMGCDRSDKWYIEPQLDVLDNSKKNMESGSNIPLINQASNADYANSEFDKGHLAPVRQANSQECAYATFTLTNAAPQNPSFNRGKWNKLEKDMVNMVTSHCRMETAHIVTGVVPSVNNKKIINNRVNVPSHFWTAYCCHHITSNQLSSGGAIGENIKTETPPEQMTVRGLEQELTKYYGVSFILFDNNCRDANHVAF
ncbi:endonuclease domain-containing 1 protein-like [Triplophysa rosa]|uniref:Endonuclease domain-containing 1 protein-like n=1 Tax=Triplophysa rosa TaxID=992332 RepID=A0A9W7WZU3_TRIRA|nr:endonuclease domain-containing 1 protein-like [Triplophysa rosa]KAI7811234.1 putative endonuclease domain-containing 1 protein-like [Triplophysa rosa]